MRDWLRLMFAFLVPGACLLAVSPTGLPQASAAGAEISMRATPQTVLDGPRCPDVMMIAARGSGETPFDWSKLSEYTSDPSHGAGAILYGLYANQLQVSRSDLTLVSNRWFIPPRTSRCC